MRHHQPLKKRPGKRHRAWADVGTNPLELDDPVWSFLDNFDNPENSDNLDWAAGGGK